MFDEDNGCIHEKVLTGKKGKCKRLGKEYPEKSTAGCFFH
jgi:hypothetical protein